MIAAEMSNTLCWDQITGMGNLGAVSETLPKGILVPDRQTKRDKVAVVYENGETPPEITVQAISGSVSSVHADSVAVAVVARANGPDLSAEDVLLVECAR